MNGDIDYEGLQKQQELQQQIQELERKVKQKLTREAVQRYGNIKTAYPKLAVQLLLVLGHMIEENNQVIDDSRLKGILKEMAKER